MTAMYRQLIVLAVTWTVVDSFTEPSLDMSNLTLSAQILMGGTCDTCCVGRNSTAIPDYIIMSSLNGICPPTLTGPPNGDTTKGHITFNSTNYATCSVNKTYSSSLSEYTLTFWINYDCTGSSDCSLSIQNSKKVEFSKDQMKINGDNFPCKRKEWKFIVLKKNSKRSVIYIDNKQNVTNNQLPSLSYIKIDPSNITNGEYFTMADVRLYKDTLTDRGSTRTKWSDVTQNIRSRSQFRNVITRNITVQLNGFCSGNSHDIAEFKVTGRCSCYGNSDSCTYRSSLNKNVCQCQNNTVGSDCSQCKDRFYRNDEDFGCHNTCQCNADGTSGSTQICDQVGGQCSCKSNVEGLQCDTCKHIHYNLNNSNNAGCSRSLCHEKGTLRCNNNVTCDMCECKTNVVNADCDACKQYHYGINKNNGCEPCNCNTSGTQNANKTCDLTTGECDCKSLVEGIQCNTCKNGTYGLENVKSSGCTSCGCNKYGSSGKNCHSTSGQCTCQEKDAEIEKMMPPYGPMSGGTVVTLTGHHFGSLANSRTGLDIFMDDKALNKFERLSWNQTTVIFKTGNSDTSKTASFLLRWKAPYSGKSEDAKLTTSFEYKSDPVIKNVNPMVSFESGGCDITIQGTSLNSVYQPKLISYIPGKDNITTNCRPVGSTTLVCESPEGTIGTSIKYGLILDGVTKYGDLSTNFPQAFLT
ncbi:USH2A [Mytilus edulis]|uniref:USH2A n=1 Tax=Mytilus edulis TaxID=6550 RepID=A0A8S3U5W1_MYTED|nr:USH2A [Mytilus edulis]